MSCTEKISQSFGSWILQARFNSASGHQFKQQLAGFSLSLRVSVGTLVIREQTWPAFEGPPSSTWKAVIRRRGEKTTQGLRQALKSDAGLDRSNRALHRHSAGRDHIPSPQPGQSRQSAHRLLMSFRRSVEAVWRNRPPKYRCQIRSSGFRTR